MKVLVVYYSESGNTEKAARAIAESVGAELKRVQDITPVEIARYDLVFFGTPVQGSRPASTMTQLLTQLTPTEGKNAAAFGTMHLWGENRYSSLLNRCWRKKVITTWVASPATA